MKASEPLREPPDLGGAMPNIRPPTTPNVVENNTAWQPRRHLPPDLAEAVRDAKLRSGRSWRDLARASGVSHPHLVLISQGSRVPSREVARRIIAVLDLDDDLAAELLDEAVTREPPPPGRPRGRVIR
jgi:cyanate lyase